MTFCSLYHISFPFPVNEHLLSRFAAYLFREGLKGGTIKNYMAAVRHAQISMGLGDPRMSDMPQLGYVIRGIKRVTGGPPRTRLPITPDLLKVMQKSWSPSSSRDGAMLWAAACMCFFGFLRCGEVVISSDASYDPQMNLSLEDVKVDSRVKPSLVEVNIKVSKTDPFRQGVKVYFGTTARDICPVTAIVHYLALRGAGPGPLFIFNDGKGLTRERFVLAVKAALSSGGIDASSYAGHSFRIGAATTAAKVGMQDSLIRTLGRWESTAYLLYIRTPRSTLRAVAGTLLRT